jgi:hypothetical protein
MCYERDDQIWTEFADLVRASGREFHDNSSGDRLVGKAPADCYSNPQPLKGERLSIPGDS